MSDKTNASTEQWLDQVHDTQAKDELNRRHHGSGHPEKVLPNKQHKR